MITFVWQGSFKEATSTSDTDIKKLKAAVADKADGFADKLDKVHNYLKMAIDNKLEIALHKAQVNVFGRSEDFCLFLGGFCAEQHAHYARSSYSPPPFLCWLIQ